MQKRLAFIFAGCLLGTTLAYASGSVHLTYSGHEGPEQWGTLAPEFAAYANGKNHSPMNLTGFIKADLTAIQFEYSTNAIEILNNGHTVQANFKSGSAISVDGKSFELKQVHFHTPSENQINGNSCPMEGHLVHADKDGNLAAVAVLYVEGDANKGVTSLWSQIA